MIMGKVKIQRNLWRRNEIKCLLDIFKEKDILNLIDKKVLSVKDIYKNVEKEMIKRGFHKKNAKQIHNKWHQIKSAYICRQKNHRIDVYSTANFLEFHNDVEELLLTVTSKNDTTPTVTQDNNTTFESFLNKSPKECTSTKEKKIELNQPSSSMIQNNSLKAGNSKKPGNIYLQILI